jgi:arsenite methyltransferase
MSEVDIKEVVRERYAEIARNVRAPGSSCCYDGESGSEGISANLYAADETKCLPQDAVTASLGCGNPTALAELREGETVLDLGSGGRHRRFAFGPSRRPLGQGLWARHDR